MLPYQLLRGINCGNWRVQFWPAKNHNGKAIVFVHGFMGDLNETWIDFQSLLPLVFSDTAPDLFYYGYESTQCSVEANQIDFSAFICKLTSGNLITGDHRIVRNNYSELLLVCHSAGAVIVRRAVINALDNSDEWASIAKMLYFSPAHNGAKRQFSDLFKGGIANLIVNHFYPIIDDLKPDSEFLKRLKNDCTRHIRGGNSNRVIARLVIWPKFERVVNDMSFAPGERSKRYSIGDHKSVCKPTRDFIDPITDLLEVLNDA